MGTVLAAYSAKPGHFRGDALLQQAVLVMHHHGFAGAGAHGQLHLPVPAGGRTGQHREVGAGVAHRAVDHGAGGLFQDHMGEDVPVIGQGGKLFQRHAPGLEQFHLAVGAQQHGEHVGKAEPPPDAAAHRGHVAELHAHNVLEGVFHRAAGQGRNARVMFQFAQGHHGPDAVFFVGFLDGIQPQTTQVDGGAHRDVGLPQPQHTAQHMAAPVLVQLIGLFKTFGPHIVLDVQHRNISPLRPHGPYFGQKSAKLPHFATIYFNSNTF